MANIYSISGSIDVPQRHDPSPLASQICGGRYDAPAGPLVVRPEGLLEWSMTYTLGGEACYTTIEKTPRSLDVRVGDLVLVPAGQPYRVDVNSRRCDHYWLHFIPRAHWMSWLDWDAPAGRILLLRLRETKDRRAVSVRMRRIIALLQTRESDREGFAMNLLDELFLVCRRLSASVRTPAVDGRLQACAEYIDQHLAESINLRKLSQLTGQSVSRISHGFKNKMGLTPIQYLELRRMERAEELLENSALKIQQVAQAVGYDNPLYFSTRFRRRTGYSPQEFRRLAAHPTSILRRPGLWLNPDDRETMAKVSKPLVE